MRGRGSDGQRQAGKDSASYWIDPPSCFGNGAYRDRETSAIRRPELTGVGAVCSRSVHGWLHTLSALKVAGVIATYPEHPEIRLADRNRISAAISLACRE